MTNKTRRNRHRKAKRDAHMSKRWTFPTWTSATPLPDFAEVERAVAAAAAADKPPLTWSSGVTTAFFPHTPLHTIRLYLV